MRLKPAVIYGELVALLIVSVFFIGSSWIRQADGQVSASKKVANAPTVVPSPIALDDVSVAESSFMASNPLYCVSGEIKKIKDHQVYIVSNNRIYRFHVEDLKEKNMSTSQWNKLVEGKYIDVFFEENVYLIDSKITTPVTFFIHDEEEDTLLANAAEYNHIIMNKPQKGFPEGELRIQYLEGQWQYCYQIGEITISAIAKEVDQAKGIPVQVKLSNDMTSQTVFVPNMNFILNEEGINATIGDYAKDGKNQLIIRVPYETDRGYLYQIRIFDVGTLIEYAIEDLSESVSQYFIAYDANWEYDELTCMYTWEGNTIHCVIGVSLGGKETKSAMSQKWLTGTLGHDGIRFLYTFTGFE